VISLFRISEAQMVDVFEQKMGESSPSTAVQEPPSANTGAVIALNDHRPLPSGAGRRLRQKINRIRAQIGLPVGNSDQPAAEEVLVGLSESQREKQIDSMIVARAFKPGRVKRRWANWQPREILLATLGGAITMGLLLLVIYWVQTM
jgi:hypothetical protein